MPRISAREPHPTFGAGRHHGTRQRIAGRIHDGAHRDEGQFIQRGDLRDARAFHVDRDGAGLAECSRLGGDVFDGHGAGEKRAADDDEPRADRRGQDFPPMKIRGERRPIPRNDQARQANRAGLQARDPGRRRVPS